MYMKKFLSLILAFTLIFTTVFTSSSFVTSASAKDKVQTIKEQHIKDIGLGLDKDTPELEKALYLSERFYTIFEYDGYCRWTQNALYTLSGVCYDYSLALKKLFETYGLKAQVICSNYHAAVVVKINGLWCIMDYATFRTFDDFIFYGEDKYDKYSTREANGYGCKLVKPSEIVNDEKVLRKHTKLISDSDWSYLDSSGATKVGHSKNGGFYAQKYCVDIMKIDQIGFYKKGKLNDNVFNLTQEQRNLFTENWGFFIDDYCKNGFIGGGIKDSDDKGYFVYYDAKKNTFTEKAGLVRTYPEFSLSEWKKLHKNFQKRTIKNKYNDTVGYYICNDCGGLYSFKQKVKITNKPTSFSLTSNKSKTKYTINVKGKERTRVQVAYRKKGTQKWEYANMSFGYKKNKIYSVSKKLSKIKKGKKYQIKVRYFSLSRHFAETKAEWDKLENKPVATISLAVNKYGPWSNVKTIKAR